MLDKHILTVDYGIAYGSVTLKSLQNDNVPELDLLVREAVQNSSDASLKEPDSYFRVNFATGTFKPSCFNEYLQDIEAYLNRRFDFESADFLEIRDTKTSGLTGVTKKTKIKRDDHGNFFKLIYDTGKKQTQTGAGGNWGFGKSVYYRVGIGIVIYYSRIKTDDGYESRMIITLVEDESKQNPDGSDATILNSLEPNSAGKAWWGIRDGDDLLPLTDDLFINPILETFGLKPFSGNETGTSVIIPYIDQAKLLNDVIPSYAEVSEDVESHLRNVYLSSVADYLKLALQKWYAPKIQNLDLKKIPGCDKKYLIASVNNVPIKRSDMLPFFRSVQDLYNAALAKSHAYDYKSDWLPAIECMAVNIQKSFENGSTSGYVAMIKISKEELGMTIPPYAYLGKFESSGNVNEPILMFARDPGMVIDYQTSGPWVKNLTAPDNDNDYLFAFYVPDTRKKLKADLPVTPGVVTLGDYLRECEASDHKAWNDQAKIQIVTRIQKNTINQINQKLNVTSTQKIDATASKLASKLGKALMPRIGYGKKRGRVGGGGFGGGLGGGKMKNTYFDILSAKLDGNELILQFTLKLTHGNRTADFELIVDSEGGTITPSVWQSTIGTQFPAEIEQFTITTARNNLDFDMDGISISCTNATPVYSDTHMKIELGSIVKDSHYTSVKITSEILSLEISGSLRIRAFDKKFKYFINVG